MTESLDAAADPNPETGVVAKPPPPPVDPKAKQASGGFILVSLLMGGAFGFGLAKAGIDLFANMPGIMGDVGLLLALPLMLFVVIGWHEFGHVVGGWATGGKFVLWCVGPLKLQRSPAGLRFGVNRSVNLMGGLAVCVPLDPARTTPARVAIMVLAGPLSSLLLAVIAFMPVVFAPPTPNSSLSHLFAYNFALITGGVSGLIFLATIFPGTAGGFKTDGKRAWDLLAGGPRAEHEAALMMLSIANLAGTRPAAYDPAMVQRVLSLQDGSLFDLYGRLSAYHHFADLGQWTRAQEMLDDILAGEEQLAPFVRQTVRNEYAWMLATRTEAATVARAWLDAASDTEFDPATRLRAEAAVRLAEGDPNGAAIKVAAGLYALQHRSLTPTINRFAEDALLDIRRAAEQLQGSS